MFKIRLAQVGKRELHATKEFTGKTPGTTINLRNIKRN
jgi:hypothetical protein